MTPDPVRSAEDASGAVAPLELAPLLRMPGAPLLVDVRLPFEHRAAHIAPSLLLPLDELDRRRAELPAERPLVLVCRTGSRARQAAGRLAGRPGVRVLAGGLEAWRAAGLPVVEGRARMSLERQVRIVAGAMAAGGGLLAVAASPWWGLLPAFVGSGLVFAGLTDRCGMATLLGKLPWNRVEAEPGGGGAASCTAAGSAPPR